ncbi:integrase catalytic domain-containing protein [Trichonephila clavipes]|nr:integrase catalytic domain-containing protein [Trichonephila clavipes]
MKLSQKTEINKPEVSVDALEELLEHIKIYSEDLNAINTEIENAVDITELDNELKSATEYRDKIITWTFRAGKKIRELSKNNSTEISTTSKVAPEVLTQNFVPEKANVKLPKLTINHFYGDNSQWLTFWNTFETAIHKNESLDKITKFNYLRTYLKGSALNSIDGLSITPENYDAAIEILISRFGKKNILINTHMNNLFRIPPLKNARDPVLFRNFFDQVQSEIRSLKSLGINSETYGNILTPMLIKLLPPNLIFEFNKLTGDSEYDLDQLLQFLIERLNATERSQIMTHSEIHSASKTNKCSLREQPPPRRLTYPVSSNKKEKNVFTAAELLTVEKKDKTLSCIFCEEYKRDNSMHDSSKCQFVFLLPLQKRKEILMKHGFCFKCIKKSSHLSRNCPERITCKNCKKFHCDILCYATEIKTADHKSSDSNMLNDEISSLLVNKSYMKQVFLQTLVVCINVNKSDYYVRVLIDSGSVKSYLSKFLAVTLNLECTGEDTIIHGLFGGIEKREDHKKYRVNVNNIDKSFSFDLDVMESRKNLCIYSKISNPKIINKIKNSGILASDICFNENMCLYENDPNEIHMLIGADFAGRLLTGEIKQITENLVAIHTRLGWTLMGESGENTRRCETLLSLHVSDLDISELWRLDTIGIKDLGENQSKRELEEAAKLHFLENVKRDHEGRYMLHEHEWENEDIIEKVESHQEIDEEHYLPHRPVFKENSTTKVRPVFDGSPIPFRATIEFHLKNAPDHYKETAHTLLESFYVDNLICSVNSKEKLDKLIVESQEILEEGKFELRGWEHNNLDPQTENTVPTERRSVPVLGLKWDLDQDLLSVDIKVHESKNEI